MGRSNIDVAQVGRELWEQSLDVLAGAIPCEHPMDCRRVSNIMQPWRSRLADGANDSGGSADMLKSRDDADIVARSTIARGEQWGRLPTRLRQTATTLDMGDQFLVELWANRHEACFEELRIANSDDLLS